MSDIDKSDKQLYERIEDLFTLRVSSNGADMGIYFRTSKERSGIESIWIDGDEWIELRQSIEALVTQQCAHSNLEILDELIDFEGKTFNKWTQKDIGNFFYAVGKRYRELRIQAKETEGTV